VEKLIIGVWQGRCEDGNLEANLVRTEQVIDEAAEAGCDFVCLPELFLSGGDKAEYQIRGAIALDDPRLASLAEHAGRREVVTIVGLCEKRGRSHAVTAAVLAGGKVAGHYTKTMLTRGDREVMADFDDELPVFQAKGVCFGVMICHDSSFPEVAATLAWKGAKILFSPHYNSIAPERMDDHRLLVRNNHIGIAAHYGLVVARSNTVGRWENPERLGYGDSAIFSATGTPLAEAGLFVERLVTADVAPHLGQQRWRKRSDLRPAIIQQLCAAALAALGPGRRPGQGHPHG
jgi:predicted amidohydrolase